MAGIEPTTSRLSGERSRPSELHSYKCRQQESNLQPTDYKSVALPIAPRRHMVGRVGLEPTSLPRGT